MYVITSFTIQIITLVKLMSKIIDKQQKSIETETILKGEATDRYAATGKATD